MLIIVPMIKLLNLTVKEIKQKEALPLTEEILLIILKKNHQIKYF
jgi:hypothetical protein